MPPAGHRAFARMAASLRQDASPLRPSSAAFVCSSCRAAALPSITLHHRPPHSTQKPVAAHRSLSTTPATYQQQQQDHTDRSSSTQRPSQSPTPYDFFPETFPLGPPPHSPFTPDLRQLRSEFLRLQAQTHPDRAPASGKSAAEARSALVNEAYRTLRDPLRRAVLLLARAGIDVDDEAAKLSADTPEGEGGGEEDGGQGQAALLAEVLMAREAVDEAEDEAELAGLRAENTVRIERSVRALEEAFAAATSRDLERAAREAVRLRYWMNIDESIQGWEKGVGGGMLHH